MRFFLTLSLLMVWSGSAFANWACQASCGISIRTNPRLMVPGSLTPVTGDAETPVQAWNAALAQCNTAPISNAEDHVLVIYYSDDDIILATIANSCVAY